MPADAQAMKDQHQQSSEPAASAWSTAADDNSMAMTIKAKATTVSPRPSDQARIANDRWSGNSDSSLAASAAAADQQGRQEPNAYPAHAQSQAWRPSGPASTNVQFLDSNTAESDSLSSWSQPLSPEPQITGPNLEPHVLSAQPQTLKAQPQTLSAQFPPHPPEQIYDVALSTHSIGLSHCRNEPQSLLVHFVPAAAEATAEVTAEAAGPIAIQTPSGMHTAQTDAAKLAPAPTAVQEEAALQLAPGHSTAQESVESAAHISRMGSFADASSKRSSCKASQHASIIPEQGACVVVPGRTHPSTSQPLEQAADAAGTSPALAAMQAPATPRVTPHTISTSSAFCPEAGKEGSVEVGSKVSVEAGKEVGVRAGAEVGAGGRMKADMDGSQEADMCAAFGGSAAWPENVVGSAAFQLGHEQTSSTIEPPTDTVQASFLEQHSSVASQSRAGIAMELLHISEQACAPLLHALHVCGRLCTFWQTLSAMHHSVFTLLLSFVYNNAMCQAIDAAILMPAPVAFAFYSDHHLLLIICNVLTFLPTCLIKATFRLPHRRAHNCNNTFKAFLLFQFPARSRLSVCLHYMSSIRSVSCHIITLCRRPNTPGRLSSRASCESGNGCISR